MKNTAQYDVTTSDKSVVVISDTDTFRFSRINGSKDLRFNGENDYVPLSVRGALSEHGFRIPNGDVEWPIEYTSFVRTDDEESIAEYLSTEKAVLTDNIPNSFDIPQLAVTYTVERDGSLHVKSVEW